MARATKTEQVEDQVQDDAPETDSAVEAAREVIEGGGRRSKNDPLYAEMKKLVDGGSSVSAAAKEIAEKMDGSVSSLTILYPRWAEKHGFSVPGRRGGATRKAPTGGAFAVDADIEELRQGAHDAIEELFNALLAKQSEQAQALSVIRNSLAAAGMTLG